MPIADYCREIEAYLCQKNDGHLIRVVGPSFEIVSKWAADGVPLKVACQGIDRYFERYYRKQQRRRPIRIDFCEADVLDVFDEWRRAVGVTASSFAAVEEEGEPAPSGRPSGRSHPSLPAHLERAIRLLTNARVTGQLPDSADAIINRLSEAFDGARAPGGLRGEARRTMLIVLEDLDGELLQVATATMDAASRSAVEADADAELAVFRDRMQADAYARARAAAIGRLVRERFGLPTLTV